MDNLEKILKELPKAKMSAKADAKLRLALLWAMLKKRYSGHRLSALIHQPAFAFNLVIMLFLCTAVILPAYAYSSPQVGKNSFLFPLKAKIEQVELAAAFSPQTKARLYDKFADKRLKEAELLSVQDPVSEEGHIRESTEEAIRLRGLALEIMPQNGISGEDSGAHPLGLSDKEKSEKLLSIASNIGVESNEHTLESVALALKRFNYAAEEHAASGSAELKPADNDDSMAPSAMPAQGSPAHEKNQPNKPAIDDAPSEPKGQSDKEQGKENVRDSLAKIKNNISNLKNEFKESEADKEKAEILINKIERKIIRIEESLQEEKFEDAELQIDIEKAEALSVYGKAFIKKEKNDNNGKNKGTKNSK